ncbi:unnamed protein product [Prunus armeniaca]
MVRHFPAQLSLGRCAICLEFRCGTLGVSCEAATRQWGRGCPNVVIGVPQVPLRESSEGDLKSSSGGITALPFGNPAWGKGQTLFLPASSVQWPTVAKSEGHVELTGEGTSERFDFRASRAVCSP